MKPTLLLLRLCRRGLLPLALFAWPHAGFAARVNKATAPAPVHDYREYTSSIHPKLRLFARFECRAPKGILVVSMHGWHGSVKKAHTDNTPDPLAKEYFSISPEMRGRGDSTGTPDCNGWELQDVVDAVEFAKVHYRDRIASPEIVLLSGGSGGGGNVFALVGKFPDYFAAARASSGISDYALWHHFDAKGEFRDEMEGIAGKDPQGRPAWIGGSPATNAEGYRSRSGLTTVGNLLTPILVFHGAEDVRVPAQHARLWVGAAHGQGKGALVTYHEQTGVGDNRLHDANETPAQKAFRAKVGTEFLVLNRTPPALPPRGSFIVAGFLKTARFEVILDSIDRVGRVDYDLGTGRFHVFAATAQRATVRVRQGNGWSQKEVQCER
ncbi:MAG: alpha/beta fold hydrolase [Verrucomicrobia bacterium]|nr:alpha/beta fold hydrolase [Verrucomicrobiota bacterium]